MIVYQTLNFASLLTFWFLPSLRHRFYRGVQHDISFAVISINLTTQSEPELLNLVSAARTRKYACVLMLSLWVIHGKNVQRATRFISPFIFRKESLSPHRKPAFFIIIPTKPATSFLGNSDRSSRRSAPSYQQECQFWLLSLCHLLPPSRRPRSTRRHRRWQIAEMQNLPAPVAQKKVPLVSRTLSVTISRGSQVNTGHLELR